MPKSFSMRATLNGIDEQPHLEPPPPGACRLSLRGVRGYDEVLIEVSDRIRSSGSIGKADIGALLFWKRLRADTCWVWDLMVMADSGVRDTSRHAVSAVNDAALDRTSEAAEGRKALSALPGFVRGGRYMAIIDGLASEAERRGHPWSPHQVNLALFALGGQKRGSAKAV